MDKVESLRVYKYCMYVAEAGERTQAGGGGGGFYKGAAARRGGGSVVPRRAGQLGEAGWGGRPVTVGRAATVTATATATATALFNGGFC